MKTLISIIIFCFATIALQGQCKIVLDEIDEFDSLRTIAIEPIDIGLIIPSKFETEDGPTLIPEAKLLVTFSQNDTINSFFLTFVIAEYAYQPVEKGYNVLLKLTDEEVYPLYNVPDSGEFDKRINMRIYQHTTILPLDTYYLMTRLGVDRVRINYKNQRRTLVLSEKQQEAIREALRCLGEKVGLYPVKP